MCAVQPLDIKAGGFRALRLDGNATSPNIVGGSTANSIGAGAVGSTINDGGSVSDGGNQILVSEVTTNEQASQHHEK